MSTPVTVAAIDRVAAEASRDAYRSRRFRGRVLTPAERADIAAQALLRLLDGCPVADAIAACDEVRARIHAGAGIAAAIRAVAAKREVA